MKFSFPRFVLIATITVVGTGTVSVTAEPCASNDGNYGQYDMTACNACAEHGNKLGGQCCDALYRHSDGRDDDWLKEDVKDDCVLLGKACDVKDGACAPGLTCTAVCTVTYLQKVNDINMFPTNKYGAYTCQKQSYPDCVDPKGWGNDGGASLVHNSSSLTRHDEGGAPSFGLVVVGLLGAAMLAMKVVKRRSSVAFRRDQYSTVEATTPIQV